MKQKGFTLTELLGVITIIAIIAVIAFPSILNQVRNKEEKVDEALWKILESATQIYIENHQNEYPIKVGSSYCITVQQLVDDHLLTAPVKKANGEVFPLESGIYVSVESNKELNFFHGNSCEIVG